MRNAPLRLCKFLTATGKWATIVPAHLEVRMVVLLCVGSELRMANKRPAV